MKERCEWCGRQEKDCCCGEWFSCETCLQPHAGNALCVDCGCCDECCQCVLAVASLRVSDGRDAKTEDQR